MRGYMRSVAIAAMLVATMMTFAAALAQSGDLWLVIRGAGSSSEAQNYYSQINAPATLQDWLTRYYSQGTEVAAMYYNAGDLGFGPDMRFK
jgi:hypothetical protein